ncbi:MAG: hypothetical protein ACWA47_13940 [Brevirhabdus sp.]
MIRAGALALLTLAPVGALADPLGNIQCNGAGWQLLLWPPNARFSYPSPVDLEIMNDIASDTGSWPRALTLFGARDTAIVILDAPDGGIPERALVLTQRAGRPILLDGRCKALGN